MGTCLVDTGNEETDTVGSFAIMLSVDLCFVGDGVDDTGDGDWSIVEEARGHGLLAHKVGEDAGVGCETSEGDAEMCVDGDDFLLVGS